MRIAVTGLLAIVLVFALVSCKQKAEHTEYIELRESGVDWLTQISSTYNSSLRYSAERLGSLRTDFGAFLDVVETDDFINVAKLDTTSINGFIESTIEAVDSLNRAVFAIDTAIEKLDVRAINVAYEAAHTTPELVELRSRVNEAYADREEAEERALVRFWLFEQRRAESRLEKSREARESFLQIYIEYEDLERTRLTAEYAKSNDSEHLTSLFEAIDAAQEASRETTWTTMTAQSEMSTLRTRYQTVKEWIMLDDDDRGSEGRRAEESSEE